jgi:hypothetical protein
MQCPLIGASAQRRFATEEQSYRGVISSFFIKDIY